MQIKLGGLEQGEGGGRRERGGTEGWGGRAGWIGGGCMEEGEGSGIVRERFVLKREEEGAEKGVGKVQKDGEGELGDIGGGCREEGEGSGGGTEGLRGRAGWIGGRCREEGEGRYKRMERKEEGAEKGVAS